jgi:hypothetical protein
VEHQKEASFRQVLALLANIRKGWKGLPGTNTPAYYLRLFVIALIIFDLE